MLPRMSHGGHFKGIGKEIYMVIHREDLQGRRFAVVTQVSVVSTPERA